MLAEDESLSGEKKEALIIEQIVNGFYAFIDDSFVKSLSHLSISLKQKVTQRRQALMSDLGDDYLPDSVLSSVIHFESQKFIESILADTGYLVNLSEMSAQALNHALFVLFSSCDRLKYQREVNSTAGREGYQSRLNPEHHGEFAYALLQLLNHHSLQIDSEKNSYGQPESPMYCSVKNIAETIEKTYYLTDKKNKDLRAWSNAPETGVDFALPRRLFDFRDKIDAKTATMDFSALTLVNNKKAHALDEMTIAVWNRNSKRDESRYTHPGLIKQALISLQSYFPKRAFRLLILGDAGGLKGLQEYVAGDMNISWVDHRQQHMHQMDENGVDIKAGSTTLDKEQQLYVLRRIMEHYSPTLVMGARSGLVALCEMVGCPGIQIDTVSMPSFGVRSRVQSRSQRRQSTQMTPSEHDQLVQNNKDDRLIQGFARCINGGMGPSLALVMNQPNKDIDAMAMDGSAELFHLTLLAMTADMPMFKHLLLEQLAAHLVGEPTAFEAMKWLAERYQNKKNALKIASKPNPFSEGDDEKDDKPSDDDDHDESDDQKKSGDKYMKSVAVSLNLSGKSTATSQASADSSTKKSDAPMSAESFFSDILSQKAQKKAAFLAMTFAQQFELCAYCACELDLDVMMVLFEEIIPSQALSAFLRHDNFLLFEHALSDSSEFYFLFEKLGPQTQSFLTVNRSYFLALMLQLEPKDEALALFHGIVKRSSADVWRFVLLNEAGYLMRVITENVNANYAWSFYEMYVSKDATKEALMADNFMVVRMAARLPNASVLLSEMFNVLEGEAMLLAVNAYGGDVVYQILLNENQALFHQYYPYLTETTLSALANRIADEAPDKQALFLTYQSTCITVESLMAKASSDTVMAASQTALSTVEAPVIKHISRVDKNRRSSLCLPLFNLDKLQTLKARKVAIEQVGAQYLRDTYSPSKQFELKKTYIMLDMTRVKAAQLSCDASASKGIDRYEKILSVYESLGSYRGLDTMIIDRLKRHFPLGAVACEWHGGVSAVYGSLIQVAKLHQSIEQNLRLISKKDRRHFHVLKLVNHSQTGKKIKLPGNFKPENRSYICNTYDRFYQTKLEPELRKNAVYAFFVSHFKTLNNTMSDSLNQVSLSILFESLKAITEKMKQLDISAFDQKSLSDKQRYDLWSHVKEEEELGFKEGEMSEIDSCVVKANASSQQERKGKSYRDCAQKRHEESPMAAMSTGDGSRELYQKANASQHHSGRIKSLGVAHRASSVQKGTVWPRSSELQKHVKKDACYERTFFSRGVASSSQQANSSTAKIYKRK